jgi:hypothetical protein
MSSEFEIKNAINNIDDALCVLVSDTDLSGEEIYKLLVERVEDAHNYFLNPLKKTTSLLNALKAYNPREEFNLSDFNYDTIANYLETENKEKETNKIEELKENIYSNFFKNCKYTEDTKHSIRVIGSDAYQIVSSAFEQDQNIDIKKYPIDIALYNSLDNKVNLNCSAESIASLWNQTIRNALIDKTIYNVFYMYGIYIKDPWKADYKNTLQKFVVFINEQEARTNFQSVFDLMHGCDQWMNKCTKEILFLCHKVQDNFDPKIKSIVEDHIKMLES